jgi:hypothetical protein
MRLGLAVALEVVPNSSDPTCQVTLTDIRVWILIFRTRFKISMDIKCYPYPYPQVQARTQNRAQRVFIRGYADKSHPLPSLTDA